MNAYGDFLTNQEACEFIPITDSVFVGHVLKTERTISDQSPVAIYFSITERFAGISPQTQQVRLLIRRPDTWLLPTIVPGRTYLVYTRRIKDELFVNFARQPRPLIEIGTELAFLRSLAHRPPIGELRGFVEDTYSTQKGIFPWSPAWFYSLAQALLPISYEHWLLHGVELRLEDQKGVSHYALSNGGGEFHFSNLPIGDYTIHANDNNLTTSVEGQLIHIVPGGCINLYVAMELSHALTGHVVGFSHEQSQGVKIEMVSLRNINAGPTYSVLTDANGSFDFQSILPGDYLLGISTDAVAEPDHPYQRWFYPGVPDQEHATAIHIRYRPEPIQADFQLPPRQVGHQVVVKVIWPDGRPVSLDFMRLLETNTNHSIMPLSYNFLKGTLTFTAFEGFSYKIEVSSHEQPGSPPLVFNLPLARSLRNDVTVELVSR